MNVAAEHDERWSAVNDTAQAVAAMRLLEQLIHGERALVRDRCARAWLDGGALRRAGLAGVSIPAPLQGDLHALAAWIAVPGADPDAARLAAHVDRMAIRCAAIDRLLAHCLRGVDQLVIVGAGLDTRAFNPGIVDHAAVFEADFAHVLEYKAARLADFPPACRRRAAVPGDATAADFAGRLEEAGFDRGAPAVWLVEGVFVYLDGRQVTALNRNIADLSAPGSRLVATFMGTRTRATFTTDMISRCDDPAALLSVHGWETDVWHYASLAREFGRDFPADDDFYLACTRPRGHTDGSA